jgi:hypothetical protein
VAEAGPGAAWIDAKGRAVRMKLAPECSFGKDEQILERVSCVFVCVCACVEFGKRNKIYISIITLLTTHLEKSKIVE